MKKLLILLLTALCFNAGGQTPEQRPNILMIAVDDLNDFIGAMGHPDAITPNIDKLASRGVLFTNVQCQAPLCGPSRASIMTGLRPSSTGIYGMIDDNAIKDVNELTRSTPFMHQYFKDAGYYLMGTGKIFHHHFPEGLLDESGGPSGYGPLPDKRFNWDKKGTGTDWGAFPERDDQMPDDAAAKWTVERLKKKYDKPFFLSVGFIRPHVPWYVPQKWFDLYDPAKLHLPAYFKNDKQDLPPITKRMDDWPMMPTTEWAKENHQWRKILQAYLACVSYTDYNIGLVLEALEESPYADNTIIVLWSDHGYRLGEKNTFAKVSLWDRALRVPLLFAGPGIQKNQKVDTPVELLSIYPTLTDLAGLPESKNVEGYSIAPLLQKPQAGWNKPALSTWGRNNHSVKTKDFRYIRYEDGSEELYDLRIDKNEWANLARKKKYQRIKEDLKKYLPSQNEKWAKESFYNANEYFRNQKLKQQAE